MSDLVPDDELTWRQFQDLVASIEHTLASAGATVKSPDFVPSVFSGEPREVDASIRMNVGSAPVLITVEARKRQDKEDVTWIEQLVTKRRNIRATKTIAVSQVGFSQEAIRCAQFDAIELRVFRDVTQEVIQSWQSPFTMHAPRIRILVHYLAVVRDSGEIVVPDTWTNPSEGFESQQLFQLEYGRPLCLIDILLPSLRRNDLTPDNPDGPTMRGSGFFGLSGPTKLLAEIDGCLEEISKLQIELTCQCYLETILPTLMQQRAYRDEEGNFIAAKEKVFFNIPDVFPGVTATFGVDYLAVPAENTDDAAIDRPT